MQNLRDCEEPCLRPGLLVLDTYVLAPEVGVGWDGWEIQAQAHAPLSPQGEAKTWVHTYTCPCLVKPWQSDFTLLSLFYQMETDHAGRLNVITCVW